MEATPDRDSEGFFSGLVNKYDDLWRTIIMPTRTKYSLEHLGPAKRRMADDGVFVRTDCQKTNLRGEKIEVTVFTREQEVNTERRCLVYLHSHGGSRVEGLGLLPFAWELGMNFCVFDFSGSGMSEGAYTTLGLRESEDCSAVIEMLQRDFAITKFVLWGRSMGAVSAILYAAGRLPHVMALVLDTPFSTVDAMVRDAGSSYAPLGQYLASFLFGLVKEEIKSKIGQDLASFAPIETCSKCTSPALFLAAVNDKLVPVERIEEQFELWGGNPKEILKMPGSHSSSREAEHIKLAIDRLRVLLDKAPRGESHKQVIGTSAKQGLSLVSHRIKGPEQKENIHPTTSPRSGGEGSPRAVPSVGRGPGHSHQRHLSQVLPNSTTSSRTGPAGSVQFIQGPSDSTIPKASHQTDPNSRQANPDRSDGNQPTGALDNQGAGSMTGHGSKPTPGGLYQKLTSKISGPTKLLQTPSPLIPLASQSPNSFKQQPQAPINTDDVWSKLPPSDADLGYYQRKYLKEQQNRIVRERDQQFMGQPRHCAVPDSSNQARPNSPEVHWGGAESWQNHQPQPQGLARTHTEVFSKFAASGQSEFDRSSYQNNNSGIRERTPILKQGFPRSVSRTPATATATPAGAQLGKWEASFIVDNRLIAVTSPQINDRQQTKNPVPYQGLSNFTCQGSPRNHNAPGGFPSNQPSSYFQRLGSILPEAQPAYQNQAYSTSFQQQSQSQSGEYTQQPKKTGFRIFEEANRAQAHQSQHNGGNFQPVDLGWDNSLITQVRDDSESWLGSNISRPQGLSQPQQNQFQSGSFRGDASFKPLTNTADYSSKPQSFVAVGPKGSFIQPTQIFSKTTTPSDTYRSDHSNQQTNNSESLKLGKTRMFAAPSLNYLAMSNQPYHQQTQNVFRAPGPNTSHTGAR